MAVPPRDTGVSRSDRQARLIERRILAAGNTLHLTFQVIDAQPFHFLPGSFISVTAMVPGLGERRSPYCLVSCASDAPNFDLLVRLVGSGKRSQCLGHLEIGEVVTFRGPGGHSMLPRLPDHNLVLCATGVGIGPLVPLVSELLDGGFRRTVRLFWGLRFVEDICFEDKLEALADAHANFSFAISLSQPPAGWHGLSGRLTETVPPQLATLGNCEFRLVGNGAMTSEMATALGEMGVHKDAIAAEAYFNGRHRTDPLVLANIRSGFVATDLAAPGVMDIADLFRIERPLGKRP